MTVMTRQQGLRYGGYTLYFIVCLVLFAYWTFPYGRLRDWLQQRIEQGAAPTPLSLQIGELSPSWLTGVTLTDVRIVHGSADDARSLDLDEVGLRVSVLSALMGNLDLSFEGESSDGSFEGEVERSDEGLSLQVELHSLDLPSVGLGQLGGLPLEGQASGTIDLTLPEDVKQSQGEVHLQVEGFAIGDGEAKLKVPGMAAGFTLERVDAGLLNLKVSVDQGTATLDEVTAKGRDIDFDATGSIRLAPRFGASRLDVTLQAKFSEAYKKRDDRTRALFELMGFQRQVKQATTSDGALRYRLGGSFDVPRASPAGKQRPTRARRAPTRRR